jgi:hypothetical protein
MKKRKVYSSKNFIESKYKIFGGFGLLVALEMMVIAFMITLFYSSVKLNENKISFTHNAGSVFIFLGSIFLILLLVIASECRKIIVDEEGITFINPFLPFLKYKIAWSYFDYFITTDEHNEHGSYNAIWFIKKGKIKKRISSFYYANYADLIRGIQTKNKGKKEYNIFFQFFAILRLIKVD